MKPLYNALTLPEVQPARRVLIVCIALIVLGFAMLRFHDWMRATPGDFKVFYAAGEVGLAHADPYRVQPLLGFEQALSPNGGAGNPVVPAPFPGYVIVLFSALALLPIHAALLAGIVITLLATIYVAYALHSLTKVPALICFSTTLMCIMSEGMIYGQIACIAIAGVVMAAMGARRNSNGLMLVGVVLSAIQPQIALFLGAALFVAIPKLRIPLVLTVAALAGIAFLQMGTSGVKEYLAVLSQHAKAESFQIGQYSLVWLGRTLGLGVDHAALLGSCSTVVMLALSTFCIYKYRVAAVESGFVALFPGCASVFAGTHVHAHQLALATVLAVVLCGARHVPLALRVATGVLLMPFPLLINADSHWPHAGTFIVILLTAVAVVYELYYLDQSTVRSRALVRSGGIVMFALLLTVALALVRPHFHPAPLIAVHQADGFASDEWRSFSSAFMDVNPYGWYFMLVKLPTWAAIICVLYVAVKRLPETAPLEALPEDTSRLR